MSTTDLDPTVAAAAARSILSCAVDVELDIDGVELVLDDQERLGLLDMEGTPGFLCEPERVVARSARAGTRATLTMVSGLAPDSADAAEHGGWRLLVMHGRLRSVGVESCTCCVETRERVVLDLGRVELVDAADAVVVVPVPEFRSPAHALNRGYLQRAAEHTRDSHQLELREAAAGLTRSDVDLILGAQLVDLTAWGATLEWVDLIGAHQHPIWFPRVASTPNELAALLRNCLHPGIC